MFFLIDSEDGEIRKMAETIEDLKKGVNPLIWKEAVEEGWVMKGNTILEGNFTVPVKDLIGFTYIHELLEPYELEEE